MTYAWEQNRAIFWSLVYPKCSKLEVYNPQVMILDILKSNDPQIFHLQNKLWGLQIIHEAWRMLWDYLVMCALHALHAP